MLHINVYLEARMYGGPEEGGWYYDQGTPLASIPVVTVIEKGKCFYLQSGIQVNECYYCGGTGEVDIDHEDGSECYKGQCECGELPKDLAGTWKLIQEYRELFEEDCGTREDIVVRLQSHFATSYPDTRPHYE